MSRNFLLVSLIQILIFILFSPQPLWGSTIQLKNGAVLQGKIVAATGGMVIIDTSGNQMTLPLESIQLSCPQLIKLAKIAFEEKEFENARQFCQAALQVSPNSADAKRLLKTILSSEKTSQEDIFHQIHQLIGNKNYYAAGDILREILADDPHNTEALQIYKQNRPKEIHQMLADKKVMALKVTATKEDLPFLHQEFLKNKSWECREGAGSTIDFLRCPESYGTLLQSLKTDFHYRPRRVAIGALGNLGNPDAIPLLLNIYKNGKNKKVKLSIPGSLNKIGTPVALQGIKDLYEYETDKDLKHYIERIIANPRFQKHQPAKVIPGKTTEGYFRGTRYIIYTPKKFTPDKKHHVLALIHGSGGAPESYVGMSHPEADYSNLIVLGPHFERSYFQWFGDLGGANCPVRTDHLLLDMLEEVRRLTGADTSKFYLFGHSEGAQFTARFALVHPDRILAAATSCAAFYPLPDPEQYFPFGSRLNPLYPDIQEFDFRKFIQLRIGICLGDNDSISHHKRFYHFQSEINRLAKEYRIECPFEFILIPDAGHFYPAGFDHGCNVMFRLPSGLPEGFTRGKGKIWVENLDLSKIRHQWRRPCRNRSVGHGPLTIAGKQFERGIGTHATSRFRIDLHGEAIRLTAGVGIDDAVCTGKNRGQVEFEVLGDKKILWKSGIIRGGRQAKYLSVDLTGVQTMELMVNDGGNGKNHDHADWVNAQIEFDGLPPVALDIPKD